MAQAVFNPDLNRLCMDWAIPIPGNTTIYGGPIQTGSEAFRSQFQKHKKAVFEQLLIFDNINFSINGPNVICPLLYRAAGERAFEELLEQNAITFTVWAPGLMIAHDDNSIRTTFVGRIGDGQNSELDIEKIVDVGLEIQQVNMSDQYKRHIRRKIIGCHDLLDEKLPATAWQVAGEALKNGELEIMGLQQRENIFNSPLSEGQMFLEAAEAILDYRFVLQEGLTSQNDKRIYDIFAGSACSLRESYSPMDKYTIISEYVKFPSLRSLYDVFSKPFEEAAKFRQTHTAKKFREWLSSSGDTTSQVDAIREYVDACAQRKGLFDSAPRKFTKLTALVAIGSVITPEAALLGAAIGPVIAGVPGSVIGKITATASEIGLSVIDSFLIDNLRVGWTPKAYFDKLQRLQRSAKRGRR